jgi:hypothetical protein
MSEHEVKYAVRYLKRKRGVAIGKSLLKTLTEPITNSDDSYRRISSENLGLPSFPISILIDRRSKLVRITDEAEGIGYEDLREKFEYYGADKSGASEGKNVRGLFGQGISDALFYHSDGVIKTIKGAQASICNFYEKGGRPYINISKIEGDIDRKTKSWGINGDHGTTVEFNLEDGTAIHEYEKLIEKLRTFYMLRFINSDGNRTIKLIYIDQRGKKRESLIKYDFPKGELVQKTELSLKYESYAPVKIEVALYRSDKPLNTVGDEKENGLLVHDDKNAVYDLTFFGLDNLPGTDKFFGFVKLTGAREIILDKINHKRLPEEILSDSRDGFNRPHEFYKELEQIMRDWLYPILNEERKKRSNDGLSESTKLNHKKAFDELNKLYNQLAGEESSGTINSRQIKRPTGGLEFARSNITITNNKKYNLQLFIDTRIIKPGSVIEVSTSKKLIAFNPERIVVEDIEARDGVFIKSINIMGSESNVADTLTAHFNKHSSSVVVSVVAEEIYYPENGLAFYPDYLKTIPNKDSTLNLYVDLSVVKEGSKIRLESSNEHIVLRNKYISVDGSLRKNKEIARLPIILSGKKIDESGQVQATYSEFTATARVDIKERQESTPPSHSGKFKDWDFDETVSMPFQQTYDSNPTSATFGYILINPNHPINQKYFGSNPEKLLVEKSLHSQLYLAEIILNESLNVIIPEALQKGGLPRRLGNDYDVLYYIAQKKYECGSAIYDLFVQESKIQEAQKAESAEVISLNNLTDVLEDRAKIMIELKFGLNEQRPHTLEEIGRKFKISRERVRQIIEKVLAKKHEKEELAQAQIIADSQFQQIDIKRDYIREEEEKISSLQDRIIKYVAESYGLKVSEMKQRTRKAHVIIPRQIALYLIRDLIGLSFPSIGEIFGLEHSTVMYAVKKIKDKIVTDNKLEDQILQIKQALKSNIIHAPIKEKLEVKEEKIGEALENTLLSRRAKNALLLSGITTVKELDLLSKDEINNFEGLGIKTIEEIQRFVQATFHEKA